MFYKKGTLKKKKVLSTHKLKYCMLNTCFDFSCRSCCNRKMQIFILRLCETGCSSSSTLHYPQVLSIITASCKVLALVSHINIK